MGPYAGGCASFSSSSIDSGIVVIENSPDFFNLMA